MNTSATRDWPAAADDPDFEHRTYARVIWRHIPLLLLCYILSYLDRVNIGFAKLHMLDDLGLSETVYGLGAGLFFIGYFIFEIPSNVIMHRVGARVWIARIMITWGLISAAMMFVHSASSFYILRFLLGVAEAGFFPGIVLYLTYWYPANRRGRVMALFMTAVAWSGVIGAPLSGWIMDGMAAVQGLKGWQWMFVLEGLPTVLVGCAVLFYLDDGIGKAKWLTAREKALLERNIASDNAHKQDMHAVAALTDGRVWFMSLIYFTIVMGLYGVGFWLPTIIKATGVREVFHIGLLTAIPYAFAVVAMIWASRSADRTGERRWHVAIPALVGAVGLVLTTIWSGHTLLAMVGLSVASMGIITALPLFWGLPTAFLGGAGAAAGIALINSVGNLAGFVSPFAVGVLKDMTQSTNPGIYLLAVVLVLGAALTLAVPARLVNKQG